MVFNVERFLEIKVSQKPSMQLAVAGTDSSPYGVPCAMLFMPQREMVVTSTTKQSSKLLVCVCFILIAFVFRIKIRHCQATHIDLGLRVALAFLSKHKNTSDFRLTLHISTGFMLCWVR